MFTPPSVWLYVTHHDEMSLNSHRKVWRKWQCNNQKWKISIFWILQKYTFGSPFLSSVIFKVHYSVMKVMNFVFLKSRYHEKLQKLETLKAHFSRNMVWEWARILPHNSVKYCPMCINEVSKWSWESALSNSMYNSNFEISPFRLISSWRVTYMVRRTDLCDLFYDLWSFISDILIVGLGASQEIMSAV